MQVVNSKGENRNIANLVKNSCSWAAATVERISCRCALLALAPALQLRWKIKKLERRTKTKLNLCAANGGPGQRSGDDHYDPRVGRPGVVATDVISQTLSSSVDKKDIKRRSWSWWPQQMEMLAGCHKYQPNQFNVKGQWFVMYRFRLGA